MKRTEIEPKETAVGIFVFDAKGKGGGRVDAFGKSGEGTGRGRRGRESVGAREETGREWIQRGIGRCCRGREGLGVGVFRGVQGMAGDRMSLRVA